MVVAGRRAFLEEHPAFAAHFVGVLSRITDSFIDVLGENDPRNAARWDPQLSRDSLLPSMVDAMMMDTETFQDPTQDSIFAKRMLLDLYEDKSAQEQLNCEFMGASLCNVPSAQHVALRETAEFLVNQKVLAHLGPMQIMGDGQNGEDCRDPKTFCGGDIIDGDYLRDARRQCDGCLAVGPYANTTAKVDSSAVDAKRVPDLLLATLEDLDALNGRSIYAPVEVGRVSGDSTSCAGAGPNRLGASSPVTGDFGDGANAIDGRSYSDQLHCEWEIRGVDCESPFDGCDSVVEVVFGTTRLWSGDRLKVYADPVSFNCSSEESSYVVATWSGFHEEDSPPIRARGCLRVVLETDSNEEKAYGTNMGDGFEAKYDRGSLGCVDEFCQCEGEDWAASCHAVTDQCFGTTRVALGLSDEYKIVASSTSVLESDALLLDMTELAHSRALNPFTENVYPNDAFCSFEFQVPTGLASVVEVGLLYDVSHIVWCIQ